MLVTGGHLAEGDIDPSSAALAEIFDPSLPIFTPSGMMSGTRISDAAVSLDDGRVLLIGGIVGGTLTGACEIFDPDGP